MASALELRIASATVRHLSNATATMHATSGDADVDVIFEMRLVETLHTVGMKPTIECLDSALPDDIADGDLMDIEGNSYAIAYCEPPLSLPTNAGVRRLVLELQ